MYSKLEIKTRSLCCRLHPWLCRRQAHPAATMCNGKAIIQPHLAATVCIGLRTRHSDTKSRRVVQSLEGGRAGNSGTRGAASPEARHILIKLPLFTPQSHSRDSRQ